MTVVQAAAFINSALREFEGVDTVAAEDLSNHVDIGDTVFSNKVGFDNFTGVLVDKIEKTIYASDEHRNYKSAFPNILKSGSEYGAIMEKIRLDYPEASDSSVYGLERGDVPEQFMFNPPKASEKFYSHKDTWHHVVSFARRQSRSAFTTADKLNAFIAYIYKTLEDQLHRDIEALSSKLFTDLIGETLYTAFSGSGYGDGSKVNAVNLLHEYNHGPNSGGTPLKAENCFADKEFDRFASMRVGMYTDFLKGASRLYNLEGTLKWTPVENQRILLLTDFARAVGFYLYGDTYNKNEVTLPEHETVPYWQGSGTAATAGFETRSKIYLTTPSGHQIEQSGIVGLIYDEDALGIRLADRYADMAHNAAGQFDNKFEFVDFADFVDYAENAVVFFVADETPSAA